MRNQIKQIAPTKPSLLSIILAWPQVIRIKNVLMMIFLQFLLYSYILAPCAYKVGYDLSYNLSWLMLQMLSTAFIAAGGYLINDYYDQQIDEINVPERRVIGKIIQPNLAFKTYIALTIIGIILSIPLFYLHWLLPVIHISCVLLLWLYARYLKAQLLIGNLTIVVLCGLVGLEIFIPDNFLFKTSSDNLDYTTSHYQNFAKEFLCFIMAATLIREWSKDIEDMEGDKKGGRATLPLVLGWNKTRQLIIISISILMLILGLKSWSLWQQAFHYSSIYVGCILCIMLLIPLSIMIFSIKKAKSFVIISRLLKIYFLLGLGWLLFFTN